MQPFDDFTIFWANYPRRVAKKEARKAWAQLKPDTALFDRIIEALQWQCESEQWTKDGGKWIPHAASWLRGERWEDERVTPKAGKAKVDWRAECAEIHGGRCTNVHFHEAQKHG